MDADWLVMYRCKAKVGRQQWSIARCRAARTPQCSENANEQVKKFASGWLYMMCVTDQ